MCQSYCVPAVCPWWGDLGSNWCISFASGFIWLFSATKTRKGFLSLRHFCVLHVRQHWNVARSDWILLKQQSVPAPTCGSHSGAWWFTVQPKFSMKILNNFLLLGIHFICFFYKERLLATEIHLYYLQIPGSVLGHVGWGFKQPGLGEVFLLMTEVLQQHDIYHLSIGI